MLELTAENVLGYLRDRGWIVPGPATVEALGGGVSNLVLRVRAPGELFVLKQSRPQLRTRDAWFSDLERVYREQEVMEFLFPLLPDPVVPRVLHSDRANFVFTMSHASENARVWKAMLLAGEVDQELGARAGHILGTIHEASARRVAALQAFRNSAVFIQLRVDPFYRRVQERRPEVAGLVAAVIEQLLSRKEALCHGDYSPKNLLIHEQGFTLVDYETAHFGDPTMDLGFFLSHMVLKAVKNQEQRHSYFDLTRRFWQAYAEVVSFRPAVELEERALGHFAVCLLARIDGTSPVDYLPQEPKRELARRLGRTVLREHPRRWEEVLQEMERELGRIEG